MISGFIVGDKEVVAKLTAMPDKVMDAVSKTVFQLGVQLQRLSVTGFLSGPRPTHLGRVTGRLAASITGGVDTRSRFERNGNVATSYVGTNVNYGRAWELGFHGLVPVKPYLRHTFHYSNSTMDLTKYNIGAGLVHYRKRTNKVTGYAWVNGFFRNVNMNPRPFLAPALAQLKPTIIAEIQKTVLLASQKAMKS